MSKDEYAQKNPTFLFRDPFLSLYVLKLPQNEVEMSYIAYEVHFLPLFYVQNIKISMYVENS